MRILFCLALIGIHLLHGKDLGVLGETFPIEEENLLIFLQKKASCANWEKIKASLIEKTKNPSPLEGIICAQKNRSFFIDPSLKISKDILDDKGAVIVRAGTIINPLEKRPLSSGLLFFDGSLTSHLAWARKQEGNFKWILIKGKPMEIEAAENRPIYFDQTKIASHFHIRNVPARVTQKGKFLLVEEVFLLDEEGNS